MSVVPLRPKHLGRISTKPKSQRFYAITIDLDTVMAEQVCGPDWRNCYTQIHSILAEHGFTQVRDNMYFGDVNSNAVGCIVAVQAISKRYAWFVQVVKELQMLRIEENDDLLPAINSQLRLSDIKNTP